MNNFKCWLCDKEFTTPDIAFAHLDDKHGGVIPAMANRISSLVEAQSTLTAAYNTVCERAASLLAVIESYEIASKTAISTGNALLKERDALKAEAAFQKSNVEFLDKQLTMRREENGELGGAVGLLRETLEFALRGNNLSMNEATRLRRVLAETGAKEVKA